MNKFLNKNIVFLAFVSLLMDISTEMTYIVLPLFLTEVLKSQPLFIGFLEAISESTASITKVFSGILSDKLNKRKNLVLTGYFISTLSKGLLFTASTQWHVLLSKFLDRFGKGIRTAPRDALISESTDQKYYGRSYGFHRAMDSLGAVIGPSIAFLILHFLGNQYKLIFGFSIIPAILAVLLVFGVKEGKSIKNENQSFKLSFFILDKKLKMFFFIVFLFTLSNSANTFLILRAKDIGVETSMIPILWLVFNLSYFFCSYPAGVLSDKFKRENVIFFGFLIYIFTYTLFAFNKNPNLIWLGFALHGVYYGFTDGNMRAFVADLSLPEYKGTTFGLYHTLVGLTLFPANILMGFIWGEYGFTMAFLFGVFMAIVSTLAFFIYFVKSPKK